MCGIVGFVGAQAALKAGLLAQCAAALRHRGPDDTGWWSSEDGLVQFGHCRLAIIDLSAAGHQPMSDRSGRVWITFNGEIYNYRELRSRLQELGHIFQTATDTEVILEAYREWGIDCLEQLNGMFSFALFDRETRKVFLARDRAGEKPLFYCYRSGLLCFASELKGLMCDPSFSRRLDVHALDFYLAYGYVPHDRCILEGVSKLPPGAVLRFDLAGDNIDVRPYWRLPAPGAAPECGDDELVDELDRLLQDSVRLRLVADVPVGILLSGGIDSSLVTAMAARASAKPVKTFTVSFPGHSSHDEGPFARIVADHFATDHTELKGEPASLDLLPLMARAYDEPIADSSMIPTFLVSRLIRKQATVALGGDGGDELFAGYHHYSWLQSQERIRTLVPGLMRRALAAGAGSWFPPGLRGRNHLLGLGGGVAESIAHVNLYFDHVTRGRLAGLTGARVLADQSLPERFKMGLCSPSHSLLQAATRVDFQTTMPEAYLVKVDRASMLNSLEVRVPWLDHRLIEFAFGRVPDRLRATGQMRKILPKKLAARVLPPALSLNRKQGFTLPLDSWFKGSWGAYVESVLMESDSSIFDKRAVAALVRGQRRGLSNTQRLYALTLFELWRREYKISC